MSFLENMERPFADVTTLVKIRPRRRVQQWINNVLEPDIWRTVGISYDNVVGMFVNSVAEYFEQTDSEADCLTTPNSFYWDQDGGGFTINLPDMNPNFAWVIVEWELFLASRHLNWHKNPMDSSSEDAVWLGGIVRSPAPTQGNPDLIFGFSPIQITNIDVQVADGFLMEHLHEWSLNGSQVKVWLCAGELLPENVSELFTGVAGGYSMRAGVLSIQVQDPLKLLDGAWDGTNFSGDDFIALDPDMEGAPIREVFGFMRSFLPVNVDYDAEPTTSNNRDWVVSKGSMADSAYREELIDTSGGAVNDGTHTTVSDARYFNPGHQITVDVAGTPKNTLVTNVDLNTGVITHLDIGARSFAAGDKVRRGFCPNAFINFTSEDGFELRAELKYGRDYTEQDFAVGTKGIVLADNFEANIIADGLTAFPATFDPSQMQLYVETLGNKVLPKKIDGITDFGQRCAFGGTAGHPVVILWEILREKIRTFRESVLLDEEAWSDMALSFDRTIGLAVPEHRDGEWPTWKEIIQLLLQTEILRLHFRLDENRFSVFTITQTSPTSGGGRLASDRQLSDPSYDWSYSDVYSRVVMSLNLGEVLEGYRVVDVSTLIIYPDLTVDQSPLGSAVYLHRVSKDFGFRSLFAFGLEDQSDIVAMRIAKIVCDRRGTISGLLPRSFVEDSIDDEVSVELGRLPGRVVDGEIGVRPYKVLRHQKSAQGVSVTLDDQKGVEDASRW